MQAHAIYIPGNTVSEQGVKALVHSSLEVNNPFDVRLFEASTPKDVDAHLSKYSLKWNYPLKGSVLDPWTGLRKTSYGERDSKKRIACSISHYRLWVECIDAREDFLILEHDAMFITTLTIDPYPGSIVGINDPRQATFNYQLYHTNIQANPALIQTVPWVASQEVPQGLAGNSAYIITPEAAKHMVGLVHRYGLWPNDAIMCRQLFPSLLVTKHYFTTIQSLPSTTSL